MFREFIKGRFINQILDTFQEDTAILREALKQNHIIIHDDENYDIMKAAYILESCQSLFGTNTVFKLGFEASKFYQIHKEHRPYSSPHDILKHMNETYKLNVLTQNETIRHYYYEHLDENKAFFRSATPFLCTFEQGFLNGFLNRLFEIPVRNITITHENPSHCRNLGLPYCNYLIEWKMDK